MFLIILIIYSILNSFSNLLLIFLIELSIQLLDKNDYLMQFILFQIFKSRYQIIANLFLEWRSTLIELFNLRVITVRFYDIIRDVSNNSVNIHIDCIVLVDIVTIEGQKFLKISHSFIFLLLFLLSRHLKNRFQYNKNLDLFTFTSTLCIFIEINKNGRDFDKTVNDR